MEKLSWRQVKQNDRAANLPNLRWGHSCCLIADEVVFFGGYADSSYMNDVWSFNTITMQWTQIETKGDIPSHRSNCSMNYDKENNRVILFGGGGANKRRFNTINVLDWKTKDWIEINPKSNEAAPWQRTYHTAELFYPYLVVFGGEGISDLDDLWIYNFLTMGWTEVALSRGTPRPCARRFHASATVGNSFFVIAGCHSKYRCLSDIYSIDLTSFFETGKIDYLEWRQRKMKDNTFLTRWGHTATVYDGKIYVFGGRFCNDLNDVLVLDSIKEQVTTLKVYGDPPKARRRHSACFLGSSMLIFGGFNGEYFNDLHYINIPCSKRKLSLNMNLRDNYLSVLSKTGVNDYITLKSSEGKELRVYKGLIAPRFKDSQSLDNFIQQIDGQLEQKQLQQVINTLYRGFGKIQEHLVFTYGINVYQSREEMQGQLRKLIAEYEFQSVAGKRAKNVDPVVILDERKFLDFIQKRRNQQVYYDVVFSLDNQQQVKANRSLLALHSRYFEILLSKHYNQSQEVIHIPFNDLVLFESLIYFLTTGFLVCSRDHGHEYWVILSQVAQYYSIDSLLDICESQLLTKISEKTAHELLIIALQNNLNHLMKACAELIIRNMVNQQKQESGESFPQLKSQQLSQKRQKVLKQVYGLLRFDILQKKIESEQQPANKRSESLKNLKQSGEQKQNFEMRV